MEAGNHPIGVTSARRSQYRALNETIGARNSGIAAKVTAPPIRPWPARIAAPSHRYHAPHSTPTTPPWSAMLRTGSASARALCRMNPTGIAATTANAVMKSVVETASAANPSGPTGWRRVAASPTASNAPVKAPSPAARRSPRTMGVEVDMPNG